MKTLIPTIVALAAAAICYFTQPAKADNLFVESMITEDNQDTITKFDAGKHQLSAEYNSNGEVVRTGANLALHDTTLKLRTDDTTNAARLTLETKLKDDLTIEAVIGDSNLGTAKGFALHYAGEDLKLGLGHATNLDDDGIVAYLGAKLANKFGLLVSHDYRDETTVMFGRPKKFRYMDINNPAGYRFHQFILGDNLTGFGGFFGLSRDFANTDLEFAMGAQDTTRDTGCEINVRGSKAFVFYRLDLPGNTKIMHYEAAFNPGNKGNWIGLGYNRINDVTETFVPECGVHIDTALGKLQINYAITCDKSWQKQGINVRAQLNRSF